MIGNPVAHMVTVASQEADFIMAATSLMTGDEIKQKIKKGKTIPQMQTAAAYALIASLMVSLEQGEFPDPLPKDLVWKGRTQAILNLN